MLTELHFKHNTVCQITTDVKFLQSPFRDNGDTNTITFPQGKCDSQIKKSVYYQDQVFLFFKFPSLNFQQSEIWLNVGYNNPCPSNRQAVITI